MVPGCRVEILIKPGLTGLYNGSAIILKIFPREGIQQYMRIKCYEMILKIWVDRAMDKEVLRL